MPLSLTRSALARFMMSFALITIIVLAGGTSAALAAPATPTPPPFSGPSTAPVKAAPGSAFPIRCSTPSVAASTVTAWPAGINVSGQCFTPSASVYVYVRDDVTSTQLVAAWVTASASGLICGPFGCYYNNGGGFTYSSANYYFCNSAGHRLDVWAYDAARSIWTFGGYVTGGQCIE